MINYKYLILLLNLSIGSLLYAGGGCSKPYDASKKTGSYRTDHQGERSNSVDKDFYIACKNNYAEGIARGLQRGCDPGIVRLQTIYLRAACKLYNNWGSTVCANSTVEALISIIEKTA